MRLILILTALFIVPTGAADAQNRFSSRSECLQTLQRALFSAQHAEQSPEWMESALSEAPEAGREHADAALDAERRRAQAAIDYADALLLLCQSYD